MMLTTSQDLELLRQVTPALALFIENALTHQALQREKEGLETLLEVSGNLTLSLEPKKLFGEIANCMRRVASPDRTHLALYDETAGVMRVHVIDPHPAQNTALTESAVPIGDCLTGVSFREKRILCFNTRDLEKLESEFARQLLLQGIRSVCCFPLSVKGCIFGALEIASNSENAFSAAQIDLLKQLVPRVAIALDNSRAYREVATLKDKLAKEKNYLEQEICDALNFQDIIGQSPALTRVLEQVRTVAPSDATVLILGETGTGKELVARAIHRLSARHAGSFIKLNCAAIPTGLLESELFGHEKGAFTGAVSQKIGRLELADKGTLLLDEVGEIPLELQPKLLRVLQDHEFERLGGTRTIRVNVRLIAATNRDLSKAVADHEFRSDLYYRLHVFPLRLPALRERLGDIPLLVRYFVQKFARRMNKPIQSIPEEAMRALESWHWPGNIRELENFLERSVILTEGESLRVPAGELGAVRDLDPGAIDEMLKKAGSSSFGTLEELERQYILQVLRQTGGVISGSQGAAALLGMKRTTLQSKMHKLGISRQELGS